MDQKLKQRLVGAIVLISLAVIFIPFILEGPDDEWSPRTPDMPEPPRIDYQAEVDLPLPGTVPEPVEAPPPETVQEPMDLAIPEPPAAGESEAQPSPGQAAVSEPAAPAAGAEPSAPAPASATATAAEKWVVQVGSFGQQLNASGLRQRLEKAGYHSYLQEIKVGGSPAWRVLVGPYGNREQAERQRERLAREQQLKGLVTRDQG